MKKLLPDLLVIFMFAVLSFAYFFPADIENRILFQHDTAAGAGAGQEATQYREETGEYTRWTNSLVGRIRWINVGILILLLHSDICRTHLEVYHAGLYTTYNSRYRTGLPG